MTPAEAAQILDLPPTAPADQVEARYNELRLKLEDKIAKAPTPGLRAKYRESLDELTAAFEVLTLAADSSALPMLQRQSAKSEAPSGGNVGSPLSGGPGSARPQGPALQESANPKARNENRKSGKEFFLVAIIAVAVLAAGGWWVMKTRAENAEKARIAAEAKAEAERQSEASRQAAEAKRQADEAKRQADEEEKARVAASEKAERERQDKLVTALRSRMAELNIVYDAVMRAEQNVERELADLKSQARDSARLGNGGMTPDARRAAAFVAAHEQLAGWLRDHLPVHPAKIARAKTEELLSSRAADEAAAACDVYAIALERLKSDIAAARDAAVITGSVRFTANLEGVLWRFRDAWGGERQGTTPATLSDVPIGSGEVAFSFTTFPVQQHPVKVERATTTVSAEFVPARLTIHVEPAEAKILFQDGPHANGSAFTLAPGVYAFRAEAPGYASRELRVTVGPAEVESRKIVLGRRPVDHLLAEFLQRLQSVSDSTLVDARTAYLDLPVRLIEVFTAAGDPLDLEVARQAIDLRMAVLAPPYGGHQTTLGEFLTARAQVAKLPSVDKRPVNQFELCGMIEDCAQKGELALAHEIWQVNSPRLLPELVLSSSGIAALQRTCAMVLEAARSQGDEAGYVLWARAIDRLAGQVPPAYLRENGGRDDWVLRWLDVLRQAGFGGQYDDLARQLQAASRSRKVAWAGNHNSDWGRWTRNRKWPQAMVDAKYRTLFERSVDKTGSFHEIFVELSICLYRAKSLAALGQTESAYEATLHSHSETGGTMRKLAPTFARLANWESALTAINLSRRQPYDYMQDEWDYNLRQAHQRDDQKLQLELALLYGAAVAERVEPTAAREALAKTADPALHLLAMTGYLTRYFELEAMTSAQREFVRSAPVP